MFIMMIYGKGGPINIYVMEALLYVQEAQLDKYRQELVTSSVTANVAHVLVSLGTGKNGHDVGANQAFRGR